MAKTLKSLGYLSIETPISSYIGSYNYSGGEHSVRSFYLLHLLLHTTSAGPIALRLEKVTNPTQYTCCSSCSFYRRRSMARRDKERITCDLVGKSTDNGTDPQCIHLEEVNSMLLLEEL